MTVSLQQACRLTESITAHQSISGGTGATASSLRKTVAPRGTRDGAGESHRYDLAIAALCGRGQRVRSQVDNAVAMLKTMRLMRAACTLTETTAPVVDL